MSWLMVGLTATSITAGIAGKAVSSSQARKARVAEYKKLLTGKLLEAKLRQEEERAKKEQRNSVMITVGSISLLSIGALIYIRSQSQSQQQ